MTEEIVAALVSLVVGIVLGWIAFGMSITQECQKIGAFIAGGGAYTCEVKK